VLLLVLGHDKPDTFIRARTRDSFAQRVVSHDLLLARPYQAAIVCSTQHARPSADVLQLEPLPTHPALALKRTSAPRQEQQHHHHLWMLIGKLQLLHHKPHTHCTRDAAMTSSTYKDAYCAVVLVERRERGMCTLMCTLCPFSSRHLHYSSSTTAPPLQLLHYSSSTTAPPLQLFLGGGCIGFLPLPLLLLALFGWWWRRRLGRLVPICTSLRACLLHVRRILMAFAAL